MREEYKLGIGWENGDVDIPFDLHRARIEPAGDLMRDEQDRIGYLPEVRLVLGNSSLFADAMEHFDGDAWSNVLDYVTARNEYRAFYMPLYREPKPHDLLRAAEFFVLPDPANATWSDVFDAFWQRTRYMNILRGNVRADNN